jgi:hypothetical protein
MRTISLDAMRRSWCAMPTLAFVFVVALLFSVQDMHVPAPDHGPDSQGHVEMMSSAHDAGTHQGSDSAEDCSVSSCSLCLAVIPAEHSASTVAMTPSRSVVPRGAPAKPVERRYRPPILSI